MCIRDSWKRFISACDYFFEQKNKATSSQRSVEQENLEKKKAIIEKLSAIGEDADSEEATQLVRDLMKEWNSIGPVSYTHLQVFPGMLYMLITDIREYQCIPRR